MRVRRQKKCRAQMELRRDGLRRDHQIIIHAGSGNRKPISFSARWTNGGQGLRQRKFLRQTIRSKKSTGMHLPLCKTECGLGGRALLILAMQQQTPSNCPFPSHYIISPEPRTADRPKTTLRQQRGNSPRSRTSTSG